MGVLILVEGDPGTGKSRAIMGLNPKETVVLRPNTKSLPFPGSKALYNKENNNFFRISSLQETKSLIEKINEGKNIKNIIVDDFSHLLGQRVLKDTPISGFKKWNELAIDAFNALFGIEEKLRDNLFIFFVVHTTDSVDSDGAKSTVMQTPGKLLDNLVKIPSYFTFVLHTVVSEKDGKFNYEFLTNRDGSGKEAKTPEGCFDLLINNDYSIVRSRIEAYLG